MREADRQYLCAQLFSTVRKRQRGHGYSVMVMDIFPLVFLVSNVFFSSKSIFEKSETYIDVVKKRIVTTLQPVIEHSHSPAGPELTDSVRYELWPQGGVRCHPEESVYPEHSYNQQVVE